MKTLNVLQEKQSGPFENFFYAIDGIVAYSTVPLVISSVIGLLLCLVSFIFWRSHKGWPSLVCIIALLSGVQLFLSVSLDNT